MERNTFQIYDGQEPYIFVSYAHHDSKEVLQVLNILRVEGQRIWYDAGIIAGGEWAQQIGEHLEHSSIMLLFLSKSSIKSQNVQREILFATEHKIAILTINLGVDKLPEELKKELMIYQILKFSDYKTYSALSEEISKGCIPFGTAGEKSGNFRDKKILTDKKKAIYKTARTLIIIILCMGALIFSYMSGVFDFFYGAVPAVTGMVKGDARALLEENGFTVTESIGYSDIIECGYIMSQDPGLGAKSFKFVPVVITESIGPNVSIITVPGVVGMYISDGITTLLECNITNLTIAAETGIDVKKGNITSQSIPEGLKVTEDSSMDMTVASDGHDFTIIIDGVEYLISGEGETTIDTENKTGHAHIFDSDITRPTCTEDGYTTHTCKICKYNYIDSTIKAEHKWSEWVVDTAATLYHEGAQTHTCPVCELAETEVIPVLEYDDEGFTRSERELIEAYSNVALPPGNVSSLLPVRSSIELIKNASQRTGPGQLFTIILAIGNITLDSSYTEVIYNGSDSMVGSIIIPKGVTLVIDGDVDQQTDFFNEGTMIINGTLKSDELIENSGTIIINDGGSLNLVRMYDYDTGEQHWNGGILMNRGKITVKEGAVFASGSHSEIYNFKDGSISGSGTLPSDIIYPTIEPTYNSDNSAWSYYFDNFLPTD